VELLDDHQAHSLFACAEIGHPPPDANGAFGAMMLQANFLDTLGAQSVPPGMIGRIVQASLYAKPGEYAKLSPSSTPQQLFQAVVDMHKAVEKVLRAVTSSPRS